MEAAWLDKNGFVRLEVEEAAMAVVIKKALGVGGPLGCVLGLWTSRATIIV